MSGWIKFWKDMPSDPRVVSAAVTLSNRYLVATKTKLGGSDLSTSETINFWCNAVTGALVTLWVYADEHIRDDDTLPLTSQALDAVVRLEGFFDAIPREWVNELDDGTIVLPGYCEKNSLIAKRKRTIKSNARVTRWRNAHKVNSNGVTNKHVTQHSAAGDLDQDLDLKNKKAAAPRVVLEPVPGLDEAAWSQWVEYRAGIKKPIKPLSMNLARRQLAKYGAQQLEVVQNSIANGYQGLIPPKPQFRPANAPKPQSAPLTPEQKAEYQRRMEAADRAAAQRFTVPATNVGAKSA